MADYPCDQVLLNGCQIIARDQRIVEQAGLLSFRRGEFNEQVGFVTGPAEVAGKRGDDGIGQLLVIRIVLNDQAWSALASRAGSKGKSCHDHIPALNVHGLNSS